MVRREAAGHRSSSQFPRALLLASGRRRRSLSRWSRGDDAPGRAMALARRRSMLVTNRFSVIAALAGALVTAMPRPTHAQQQDPRPALPPVGGRWDNGVSIEATDGENKLQLGGLVQLDGRFDVNDPTSTVTDTFL